MKFIFKKQQKKFFETKKFFHRILSVQELRIPDIQTICSANSLAFKIAGGNC